MNALLFKNQYRVTMELRRMDGNPRVTVNAVYIGIKCIRGFWRPFSIRSSGVYWEVWAQPAGPERSTSPTVGKSCLRAPAAASLSNRLHDDQANCTRKGRGLRGLLVHEKSALTWKREIRATTDIERAFEDDLLKTKPYEKQPTRIISVPIFHIFFFH